MFLLFRGESCLMRCGSLFKIVFDCADVFFKGLLLRFELFFEERDVGAELFRTGDQFDGLALKLLELMIGRFRLLFQFGVFTGEKKCLPVGPIGEERPEQEENQDEETNCQL